MDNNGIYGSVAVQSTVTEQETGSLIELSKDSKFILGVVAWVNLHSKGLEHSLDSFGTHQKFKGVRHPLEDEMIAFMHCKSFKRDISMLQTFRLSYYLLIHANQLKKASKLAAANPEQIFIINHLVKPAIRDKQHQAWRKQIEIIAHFLTFIVRYPVWQQKQKGMVGLHTILNPSLIDLGKYWHP